MIDHVWIAAGLANQNHYMQMLFKRFFKEFFFYIMTGLRISKVIFFTFCSYCSVEIRSIVKLKQKWSEKRSMQHKFSCTLL